MVLISSNTPEPAIDTNDNPSTQMNNDIQVLLEEYKRVEQVNIALQSKLQQYQKLCGLYEPGHFYSAIPAAEDLARYRQGLSKPVPDSLPDIDLNVSGQLELLAQLQALQQDIPFSEKETTGQRYYYQNNFYTYNDAIMLYAMMRHLKPKRIIEIGSGFSSAAMLDVNDKFFNQEIACEFIEPYPQERLLTLLSEQDVEKYNIHVDKLQDVDLALFSKLEDGDILFVDSSHVSKVNSDVNRILFEVFPQLNAGVNIHIHDIFYPFEYLPNYYDFPVFWNECYILRAFLANNSQYKIELFGDYMRRFHPEALSAVSPLCLKDTGSHIWLKKMAH